MYEELFIPNQHLKWVCDGETGELFVKASNYVKVGAFDSLASHTGEFDKNEVTVKLIVYGTDQPAAPPYLANETVLITTKETVQTPDGAVPTIIDVKNHLAEYLPEYRVIAQVIKPSGGEGEKATNVITQNEEIEIL